MFFSCLGVLVAEKKRIMNREVFIIAEIGQAHDGSLGILHSYIDAVAATGVDAIKFQTHIAEAESSIYEPFRVPFSYEDRTRYDYWKRMEFRPEQWQGVKDHCESAGVEFISSPFSCAAVDMLAQMGVHRFKIGSGEVSNLLILEKIARTKKEIILSSGMSRYSELDEAVKLITDFGNRFSVLQCTSKYPSPAEEIGLNVIGELRQRYGVPVGLSDHSGTIYPALAAVALGADIVEVHAVFDKRMFGPDAASSLTIDMLKQMVDGIRFIQAGMDYPVNKNDLKELSEMKKIFEKSLAVNRNLPAGHIIDFSDLESKKPSDRGIPAREYQRVIGKRLTRDKAIYDFLTDGDIS